jgi:hypothetical protein
VPTGIEPLTVLRTSRRWTEADELIQYILHKIIKNNQLE